MWSPPGRSPGCEYLLLQIELVIVGPSVRIKIGEESKSESGLVLKFLPVGIGIGTRAEGSPTPEQIPGSSSHMIPVLRVTAGRPT